MNNKDQPNTQPHLTVDQSHDVVSYAVVATQPGYFKKKSEKRQFIIRHTESPLLRLSNDLHRLIAAFLSVQDRRAFATASYVLWRNKLFRTDWLCSVAFPRANLLPTYLINHVLRHQSPKKLERLLNLLPKIKVFITNIMSCEADALWILYALLHAPTKVKEILGAAIAVATDQRGNSVPHFYALTGDWDAFTDHKKRYDPNFTYENNARCNDLYRFAILGDQISFYQLLCSTYKFPDFREDAGEALFLLMDGISSGKMETVKALVAMCPEAPEADQMKRGCFHVRRPNPPILGYEYLAQAVRLGHWDIADLLTAGNDPFCIISNREEAAEILTLAAQFDDLPRVRFFLEDRKARSKWHLTSKTTSSNVTLRKSVLSGGSENVLRYFQKKNPRFLATKWPSEQPALLICAEYGRRKMCRLLLETRQQAARCHNQDGEYSIHAAAKGGHYPLFMELAERDFADNKLLPTAKGVTPIHVAAAYGRYWMLKQLLEDFGMNAFLAKTQSGATTLHYACRSLNLDVIKLILQETALSMDDQDNNGNTPLHHAVYYAHLRLGFKFDEKSVREFIEKFGAALFYRQNKEGKSPFDSLSQAEQNIVRGYEAISVLDLSI